MLETIFFYIEFLNTNLDNNFIIFILLYIIFIIIFFTFSLPGGPIPLMLSGFFFGFYLGFFINILSLLIGSYFFVTFAKNILKKFFSEFYLKLSKKFDNLIKNSSYEYLIIFRLIQGNPLFVQNLCISFLNLSKIKFLISSFIGFCPAVIIFTYVGSKFSQIYQIKYINYSDIITKDFIYFLIFFILILILRIIYKRTKK